MKPTRSPHTRPVSSLDPAFLRWRSHFAPFEATCFDAFCNFVRADFDQLLDRYYCEGRESLKEFSAWAFERYLRETERNRAGGKARSARRVRLCSSGKQHDGNGTGQE